MDIRTTTARVREVNLDAPAIELLVVEAGDGGFGLSGAAEGHKSEAARATCVAIAHDDGLQKGQRELKTRHSTQRTSTMVPN